MKQKLWINLAKFAAIIAVLVDHTNRVLYTRRSVAMFSYYSVSLFIFIMGVTTYLSFKRNIGMVGKKVSKQILGILVPYIIATFIYQITRYKQFDFMQFLKYLVSFNISGPFYYVLLYIQLLLISPVIFYFIEFAVKKSDWGRFSKMLYLGLGCGVVLAVSSWTTNRTNILNIYGGGVSYSVEHICLSFT